MSLRAFVSTSRVEMTFDGKVHARKLFRSEIVRAADDLVLENYMADRVPLYYRAPEDIAKDLDRGYFTQAIADTLGRLPKAKEFRDSHFGELLAAEFAVAAMGLRLLYTKVRLLTAENANAYKMDVVMYDPEPDEIELVLLEVKASIKQPSKTKAARHDKSIYSSLFSSLNKYGKEDLRYDLTAARDRLTEVAQEDRHRVELALSKYGGPTVRYAGVCSIDIGTYVQDEAAMLATRKNEKTLDVDLVCVAEFAQVIEKTFTRLERIRTAAC